MVELNIHDNNLTTLPESIDNLIHLKYLYIQHNNLTTLPESIGNLIHLQHLNIKHNNLTTLPESIGNLIHLRFLNIQYNNLTTLPESIGNLVNLTDLYIQHNKLTTLPESFGNLINLKYLYFQHNKLNTLPESFGNLINLKYLNIYNNELTTLPESFGNMVNLREIYIYFNKIISLPESIGNLINLRRFEICDNELTNLPESIGNLINLRRFIIYNNKITTIPFVITNLHRCQIFYYGNQIEYLNPAVQRFLNQAAVQRFLNQEFIFNTIYNDMQSVHDHNIQESIRKSIQYIMNIKPKENINISFISENKNIKDENKTLLLNYCQDDSIHCELNINFKELLINVISHIESYEEEIKLNIYQILNNEIKESKGMCFTGRMSRLINCLNGFDDNIIINISDKEQVTNIIILIKNKLINEGIYTVEKHKELVSNELKSRNYTDEYINEWISYIE